MTPAETAQLAKLARSAALRNSIIERMHNGKSADVVADIIARHRTTEPVAKAVVDRAIEVWQWNLRKEVGWI